MGTFVFKWEHPASEVYVTGTFDDWSKSEKLIKTRDIFEKEVTLSSASAADKIYYKFVVDGNWVTDHTAPQENDASGNLNNVLTTDRVSKHTPTTAGIMSGVTPNSTTARVAKDAPVEEKVEAGSSDLPGSFPETPGVNEKEDFSVAAIPAADKNIAADKNVAADKNDDDERVVGVSPLPAFPGAVNPIKLVPGEKVPDPTTLTGNTINSSVRTDKQSYENSGAFGVAPINPPAIDSQSERDKKGTGALDLPIISKNVIPESSLPMGVSGAGKFNADPTIQSAGPQSTTAQLAANVPLESTKVPNVVKNSQREAGASPEASAVPEELKQKSAVEKELLKEVPVAPSTFEGTGGSGTDKSEHGTSEGGVAAAAREAHPTSRGAVTATAQSTGVVSKLPETIQASISDINAKSSNHTAAKNTPHIVEDSIAKSGWGPEAAANEDAVMDKNAVEKELLAEVRTDNSKGESAPEAALGGLDIPATGIQVDSRDVSPHTTTQTAPTVTTGVASGSTNKVTNAAPATPAKDNKLNETPASDSSKIMESPASNTASDKKKKRTSIFGKLKAKFSDKH